ncbi:MAG: alpha/beta fold hydrolase [Chloroflexota bacterium]
MPEPLNEPQVQYATTSDGVKIAFWVVGRGPALFNMPPMPYSNIRKEWAFKPQRRFYEDLASGMTVIRYDCRGAGLSDRAVSDFSIEAYAKDILAIADHLGLETFGLFGFGHSGGIAINLAAACPKRVSHLVLWCCYPRGADYGRGPRVKLLESLMDEDWDFWSRAESLRLSEYEGGTTSAWFLDYIRDSVTEEGAKAAVRELRKIDVTKAMSRVLAPTLVLHRLGLATITVEMAREMASTVPNARLALYEGTWIVPFFDGTGPEIAATIRSFMNEPHAVPAAPRDASDPPPSVLTPRERQVLALVAGGRTSRAISDELDLSVRTVGRHITNIYAKIGARTRGDAIAYAFRHRLT